MLLTEKRGLMQRIEVKQDPIFKSVISPGQQGNGAWGLLNADQRGHLDAALKNAGEFYQCTKKHLQWKIDRGGSIHVRKRPRIAI